MTAASQRGIGGPAAACLLLLLGLDARTAPASAQGQSGAGSAGAHPFHFVVEGYPAEVGRELAPENRRVQAAASFIVTPYHLVVPDYQRWVPGQMVRVAFSGGTATLHAQIEAAAQAWVAPGAGNLRLSFRNADGSFRTWQATDTSFQAEIRIAFVGRRLWSHVGRNSINVNLPGGRPGEASMNLGGFDQALPNNWRGTVLHEFGHALGFEHEHQSPAVACRFRFYDDSGYVQTTDPDGWFVPDGEGRRPGLYTYLGGETNHWLAEEVDLNLKAIEVSSAFMMSAFDTRSIMRYSFDDFFFENGSASPCAGAENNVLSTVDLAGIRAAYPVDFSDERARDRTFLHQMLLNAAEDAGVIAALRRSVDD